MRRMGGASVLVVAAVGLAACGRLGLGDPMPSSHQTTYEPLPAAPTAPVTSSALPPPAVSEQPLGPAPGTQPPGTAAPGTPVASATMPPAAAPEAPVNTKGPPLGRGDFVGAWRIASGADNCQLFASLTSWAGGMRASTKGCNSVELQHVSAWDISGRQVFLKGGDGATLATLGFSGPERYAGNTTSKQAITLSR